jgi:Fusaric acid resistance protein-like
VFRGVLGNVVGFIVGGALVALVGTNTTVLWVLLPLAVLFAGLAPAAISFAAGQAAFTLTLLILYNILQPAGWQLGLVRIEDIVLGSSISLVVGLLFWPRGAAAALGTALAQAYSDSARYLAGAVEFGMGRCDAGLPDRPAPTDEAIRAAAASRRLDDTFRGYLAERGAKPIPLADVTGLVNGAAGLRLASDAVLDLWQRDDGPGGDRAAARQELLASTELMVDWYDGFAASLAGRGEVPEPLPHDELADGRLVDAISRDLRLQNGQASATAARMIWTGDHLDAARRLQDILVGPARTATQRPLTSRWRFLQG